MAQFFDEGFDPDDLSIRVSDMLIATADASDELIDKAVSQTLLLLRQRLKMDVVFVSEFVDGKRVFRYADTPPDRPVIAVGDSDPLEQTWCQRVVDGRMPEVVVNAAQFRQTTRLPDAPFDIGTHLSTPILLDDGQIYGTLCCFSFSPHASVQTRDLKNLKSVAQLVARKIDTAQARLGAPEGAKDQSASAPVTFTLQPKT